MRNSGFVWIILGILLLLDLYVFQVLKFVTGHAAQRTRMIVLGLHCTISVLAILFLLSVAYMKPDTFPKSLRTYVFAIVLGLFFAKLIAATFFLIDDLRRGMMLVIGKLFSNPSVPLTDGDNGITRSAFLSWLGMAAGGTLFGTLVYGFSNKYNYTLKKIQLAYANLPAGFRGLKIVHISDIHSGSFTDEKAVLRGIEKIQQLSPDIILFTGDLVNDRATEMDLFAKHFTTLQAPMGVYSTLGNHDYGDYVQWDSEVLKKENLEQLKKVHASMGWRLLMNEHVVLKKGGDEIALLGIENWGAKGNFPKYGKMTEAYPGTEKYPFKILMSHDPSHWEAEVQQKYADIDLTLSGHTHGMQFGVEIPGFKWSPVQYMYKQWAGLYEKGRQKLYVNRGFGFIGYPGRVGILPEITLIELV
jgi:uncharacterized protein